MSVFAINFETKRATILRTHLTALSLIRTFRKFLLLCNHLTQQVRSARLDRGNHDLKSERVGLRERLLLDDGASSGCGAGFVGETT